MWPAGDTATQGTAQEQLACDTMAVDEDKRGPGLKFPPPLLAIVVVLITYLCDWVKPLPIVDAGSLWLSGSALIAIALILMVIALVQFLEAKTHIEPWRPTTRIIQDGIFRYSRNPIYVAFCIATAGGGLLLNSWWVIAGILPLVLLLQQLVIKREETYLESKFGKEYLDYKARVRRWI